MSRSSEGKCMFCNGVFKKGGMKRHLEKCKSRTDLIDPANKKTKSTKYYCIRAQGFYETDYWIYMDIPANSNLYELDSFLREIWLECCGHLSQFIIGGEFFDAGSDFGFMPGGKTMDVKINKALKVNDQFIHEYDFGSTTKLKLKVVSEYSGKKRKKKVNLLARNTEPYVKCVHCDRKAAYLCSECAYGDEGWFCDECAKKHECGEEMLLPVVNSPRAGVCGYCG